MGASIQGAIMIDTQPQKVQRSRRLYFSSQILVSVGDKVEPRTVIAKTLFPLPRLFFLNVFAGLQDVSGIGYDIIWHFNPGETVDYGTEIASFCVKESSSIREAPKPYICPMAGTIEDIILDAGNVLLRECINYDVSKALVQLSGRLSVPKRLLKRFLLVREGTFVEKGQTLAQQIAPGNFERIEAPIAGIVTEVDPSGHHLVIERRIEEVPLYANFFGSIKSIGQMEIVIEGTGIVLNGKCGIGASSSGKLIIPDELSYHGASATGAILLVRDSISDELLKKAIANGAKGIIAAGADHKALSEFTGYDLAVAFTGKEDVPFPIVITEGFGEQRMNDELFNFLAGNQGKWVYINGRTQLRAGVIRPEIIVLNGME